MPSICCGNAAMTLASTPVKRERIGKYKTGLVKCAHQILYRPKIDPGLPTNTGIHLRQECGRNLDDCNSSHVQRSDETGNIAHNSAAQCNQRGLSSHAQSGYTIQKSGYCSEILRPFAIGNQRDRKAFFQILSHGLEDPGLGHNKKRAVQTGPFQVFFEVTQQSRPDNDAVGRVVQPDRNSVQG